jgi:tight adherence protein C
MLNNLFDGGPGVLSLIFIFSCTASAGLIASRIISRRQASRRLLKTVKGHEPVAVGKEADPAKPEQPCLKERIMSLIIALGKLSGRKGTEAKRSGPGNGMARANDRVPLLFAGLKIPIALAFASLSLLLGLAASRAPMQKTLFVSLAFGAAGFYAPDFVLHAMAKKRKRDIEDHFPEAMDLMVICVEAGMGIDSAISRVAREITLSCKALGEEFDLFLLELKAGKNRQEALRNLSLRIGLEEVDNFVSLLSSAERFGGTIAQMLRNYSDAMRARRSQRAEEAASKLPVRLVFPLIIFIFPSIFVTILGPAAIQIYKNFMN